MFHALAVNWYWVLDHSIIGFVFRAKSLSNRQTKYLLTILFLSIIHITVTSLIYFISLKVIDLIKEFYFRIINFFIAFSEMYHLLYRIKTSYSFYLIII